MNHKAMTILTFLEKKMQSPIGRPKDLEKKQRILESAKALFLKFGYQGSSMNQIAQDAGVTKLTVYNHFQDKATLFSYAIESTCEESLQARPMQLSADSNFEQALFSTSELALQIIYLPEALKLEHLLLQLASEQNPLAMQFFKVSHQKLHDVWSDFFQQAIQLKFLKPVDTEQLIHLMLSLLLGFRHHEVLLGVRAIPDAEEIQQIIHDAIDLFLLKYSLERPL